MGFPLLFWESVMIYHPDFVVPPPEDQGTSQADRLKAFDNLNRLMQMGNNALLAQTLKNIRA